MDVDLKVECTKLRTAMAKAKKTQEKAAIDRNAARVKLEELENRCQHQYGKARLVAKTERYERECEFCGKIQESKPLRPEY